MSYDTAKYYGNIVRDAAERISSCDDIYKVATALPYDMRAYFIQSRIAFSVLYMNIKDEKEIVAKVIKKFILSPEVDKYIITNPDLDKSKKFDFIENDCGDFFTLMETIKSDIIALDIISRPNEFEEDKVAWAVNLIADRIKPTPENQAAMKYSLETLFPIEQQESKADTQLENEEPKKSKTIKPKEDQALFEIKDDKQCVNLYHFLIDTKVLDGRTTLPAFLTAMVQANMSKITPNHLTRFRCAVARAKYAIRGDIDLWSRIACGSIGKTPSQALSGASNNGAWYEDLCKILPEHPIKK